MIDVRMRLQSAVTHQTTQLVRIKIWNDGTGTPTRGNYGWQIYGRNDQQLRRGDIHNWPRKSKTAMALLQRVINDAYPKSA